MADREGRKARSWRDQAAPMFVALTTGLGINNLSTALGWRAFEVAAVLAGVLVATNWLRARPRAPVVGVVAWTTVGTAGLAAAVSPLLEVHSTRAGHLAVMVAAALTAVTILLRVDGADRRRTLTGLALVATGITVVRANIVDWIYGAGGYDLASIEASIALLPLGAAFAVLGFAFLANSRRLGAAAFMVGGVGFGILGFAFFADGLLRGGVALVVAHFALVAAADDDGRPHRRASPGVAGLRRHHVLLGVVALGCAVAAFDTGLDALRSGYSSDTVPGLVILGVSLATVGLAAAFAWDNDTALSIAALGFGLGALGLGASVLATPHHVLLSAVAFFGLGIPLTATGLDRFRGPVGERLGWLVREPPSAVATVPSLPRGPTIPGGPPPPRRRRRRPPAPGPSSENPGAGDSARS